MISLVIFTYNEASKLQNCLASVSELVNEIVLVDLESSDDTLKVAKSFNAKIINHPHVNYVEKVRNVGLEAAKGDWILLLDPDERITPELKSYLLTFTSQDKYVALNIPSKNIFFNRWIAHTSFWPDHHIRFFRKGSVVWLDQVHSYPQVSGKIFTMEPTEKLAIEHHSYASFEEFLDKQNRYSTIEAKKTDINLKFILSIPKEFIRRFFIHQGYKDGFIGFSLSFLLTLYKITVLIKIWERKLQSS